MPPRRRAIAALLGLALFGIYNLNGREMHNYDSRATKLAAVALASRGTMTLDLEVAQTPVLASYGPFQVDRQGHYRSAYSPVAALFGAATAWTLSATGVVQLDAPFAPALVATVTASALTSLAVCLVFLTLTRLVSPGVALAVAVGLGLGTNFWIVNAKTLGQQEVVAFGLAMCLFAWTRRPEDLRQVDLWVGGLGLGLAVTARFQTLPLVSVMLLGLLWRTGLRRAIVPGLIVGGAVSLLLGMQWYWFGHPLGAMPRLLQLQPTIHLVQGSWSPEPWIGAAGLLVSPSRGLLIFSPIVLIAAIGAPAAVRRFADVGLPWFLAAAAVEFGVYSAYVIWWGGHSFGPRYLLDVLVLLTPAAAIALETALTSTRARAICVAALVWSMAATGTGAFFADNWNATPVDVDKHHERLWDWRDPQLLRAWRAGLSSANFVLFSRSSFRRLPDQ